MESGCPVSICTTRPSTCSAVSNGANLVHKHPPTLTLLGRWSTTSPRRTNGGCIRFRTHQRGVPTTRSRLNRRDIPAGGGHYARGMRPIRRRPSSRWKAPRMCRGTRSRSHSLSPRSLSPDPCRRLDKRRISWQHTSARGRLCCHLATSQTWRRRRRRWRPCRHRASHIPCYRLTNPVRDGPKPRRLQLRISMPIVQNRWRQGRTARPLEPHYLRF